MFNPDPTTAMKLLHVAHMHAQADENADSSHDTTFKLRLAAIFVILVAGLLGVMPPLIGSWLSGSPNSVTARVIRAASGGIILALALIHIIPESIEQLDGAAGALPLGGLVVMGGLLAMLILEYVATFIGVNHLDKHHKTILPTTHGSTAAAAPESPVLAHDASGDYNKLCKTSTPTTAAAAAPEHVTGKDSHGHVHSEAHAVDMIPSLAHSHGCRQQPACHTTAVKQQVTCITMELGCVFHSVVLGLALGVMKDAPQMVVTLLVVLSIHQAVEGLALGSVLVSAQRMSQPKRYVFAVVYALTLPVGIAAGLLASETYDPMSPVAVLVQGVANGLSGGMLLYVSLFSLLSAELSQHDLLHRPGLAGGLMVAALVGAAIMCVIGLWA